MGDAFATCASAQFIASFLIAALTASVSFAFATCTLAKLFAAHHDAALTTFVSYAFTA
jgi:hypothetical protein